eukprot:COSAG01_NODE_3665_length_5813_cov_11.013126_8_plen_93_part_00
MSGDPRVLQNPPGGYAVLRCCDNDLPQQVLNCGRPDTRPSPIVSEVASSALQVSWLSRGLLSVEAPSQSSSKNSRFSSAARMISCHHQPPRC